MNNSFLSIINGVSLVISFKEREREEDVNNFISIFILSLYAVEFTCVKRFFVFVRKRFARICPSLIVEFCMVDIKQRILNI